VTRGATAARPPADEPGLPPRRRPISPPLRADSRLADEPPGSGQVPRAWGSRPARLGPVTVIFGALAGGILTVLADSEPGWLLGLFVVVATAAGASAVRRTAAYLVIPVPALAYFLVAVIAGIIHDRNVDTTRAILFVNAVQWIASGFFWMFLSTVVAIAITIGRWLMTGRAGYRVGVPWVARFGVPWSDQPSEHARPARASGARPGTARSSTASSGTSRSDAARPATAGPGHAPAEDAAATQPMPRETLDTEHSADA
jgi:hypothetical protein